MPEYKNSENVRKENFIFHSKNELCITIDTFLLSIKQFLSDILFGTRVCFEAKLQI